MRGDHLFPARQMIKYRLGQPRRLCALRALRITSSTNCKVPGNSFEMSAGLRCAMITHPACHPDVGFFFAAVTTEVRPCMQALQLFSRTHVTLSVRGNKANCRSAVQREKSACSSSALTALQHKCNIHYVQLSSPNKFYCT
jgi:hypothetical protein